MTLSRAQGYSFSWEQQVGATTPHDLQQDRVCIDEAYTAQGERFLLAVIADGDENPQAGLAAESVIDHIFSHMEEHRGDNLSAALISALETAHSIPKQFDSQVSTTAILLHRNKLYSAHSGSTSAVLVREGRCTSLTRANTFYLGGSKAIIQSGSSQGVDLMPGDSILLATDGVTRASSDDGKPYVSMEEIAEHVSGNSPSDASRHLVSLAMGRDVDDNVTVAIIQLPGKTITAGRAWIIGALILGLLIISSVAWLFWPKSAPQPHSTPSPQVTDYGYAVLVDGAALNEINGDAPKSVRRLEAIPPLSWIMIEEPSKLTLGSTQDAAGELSTVSFFLSPGSRVKLLFVDDGSDTMGAHDNQTTLALESGMLVINREGGTRVYQVELPGGSASLIGSGRGVLAAEAGPRIAIVDCLEGECEIKPVNGDLLTLQAGLRITLSADGSSEKEVIPLEALTMWNTLCRDCLNLAQESKAPDLITPLSVVLYLPIVAYHKTTVVSSQ
ncbi:MAG: SpoIIE family protein phosphatase [Anaerolineales bacterium]|nr:SpoIIE family protein phosphatase [Anaerolineales bacterium]